jgi:DNA-binding XRE family transcriptional regulator
MKNIIKKKIYDPIAEARNKPNFKKYYEEAGVRIRLAQEVSRARKEQNLSQQELAKRAETTQKIISEIEYGDYNVGLGLYNRIIKALNLGSILYKIHECGMPVMPIAIGIENKLSSYKPIRNRVKKGQKTLILK